MRQIPTPLSDIDLSGYPVNYLKVWRCMLRGYSTRKIAELMGGISHKRVRAYKREVEAAQAPRINPYLPAIAAQIDRDLDAGKLRNDQQPFSHADTRHLYAPQGKLPA